MHQNGPKQFLLQRTSLPNPNHNLTLVFPRIYLANLALKAWMVDERKACTHPPSTACLPFGRGSPTPNAQSDVDLCPPGMRVPLTTMKLKYCSTGGDVLFHVNEQVL